MVNVISEKSQLVEANRQQIKEDGKPRRSHQIMVENAPVAMAMFDLEMRYVIANRRWLKEFRLEGLPVVGRKQGDVFPGMHDRWAGIYEKCMGGQIERCEEDVFERADGTRDWVRWEVRPWRQPDLSVGGLLINCEIITPLKEYEQQLQFESEFSRSLMGPRSLVAVVDEFGKVSRCSERVVALSKVKNFREGDHYFVEGYPLVEGGRGVGAEEYVKLVKTNPTEESGSSSSNPVFVETGGMAPVLWQALPRLGEDGKKRGTFFVGVEIDPSETSKSVVAENKAGHLEKDANAGVIAKELADLRAELDKKSEDAMVEREGLVSQIDALQTDLERAEKLAASRVSSDESDALSAKVGLMASENSGLMAKIAELNVLKEKDAANGVDEEAMAQLETDLTSLEGDRDRLKNLVENAPFAISLIAPDGLVIYRNIPFSKLLGYDCPEGGAIEEYLSRGCPDKEYAESLLDEWREKLWQKGLTRVFSLANAAGLIKEVEFRPALLPDGNLLLVGFDATERIRGEEAIRASEARFRSLFQDSSYGIALVDSGGAIFEVNPALERLIGHSRLEMRRRKLCTIVADEDRELGGEPLDQLLAGKIAPAEVELRVTRRSGSPVPVRLAVDLIRDHEGNDLFTTFYFTQLDGISEVEEADNIIEPVKVSQEDKAGVALAAASVVPVASDDVSEQVKPLVDPAFASAFRDLMLHVDHDGQVLRAHVPEGFAELAGLPAEIEGTSLALTLPEASSGLMAAIESDDQLEGRIMREVEGKTLILDYTSYPSDEESVLLTFRESVSEKNAAAVPLPVPVSGEADDESAVDDAVRSVHHRVRNNLQIIQSLINLQLPTVEDKEARQALQASQRRIHAITALHEQLESAEECDELELQDYLSNLVTNLKDTYDADAVEVKVECGDATVPVSRGVTLGIVATELVGNAFRHAFPNERPGLITVEVEKGNLSVHDNGAGLPDGFELASGAGLGLRIVRTLVQQLGGNLSLEDTDGVEFRVGFQPLEDA